MTKPELFAECKRLASNFVLAWTRNALGEPEVRASCTWQGRTYTIAHTPCASDAVDAEATVMHGLLDAVHLFGGDVATEVGR